MMVCAEAGGRFSLRERHLAARALTSLIIASRVGAFDNLLSGQTQSRERNTKQETGSGGVGGGKREREGSHRR